RHRWQVLATGSWRGQMLRTDAVGVSSHITLAQGGGSQRKKVLVVVAFLVLAAACGGGNSGGSPSSKEGPAKPVAQGDGSRGTGVPGETSNGGGTTTLPGQPVPALQGPPVIRQAQLSITVGSGKFTSKLSEVRTLVEGQGGYIAGTDAQATPLGTDQTGQIEQLKGQIKYLDDNTSYSSVAVTLSEAGAPAQTASNDSWGFATALNDAAHNFVATINYVVTALGAIGPLVVLAGLGFLLWR